MEQEYLDDNCLEQIVCEWKLIMQDSITGKGTSYDIKRLNEKQKKCYYCNGLDTECKRYR